MHPCNISLRAALYLLSDTILADMMNEIREFCDKTENGSIAGCEAYYEIENELSSRADRARSDDAAA